MNSEKSLRTKIAPVIERPSETKIISAKLTSRPLKIAFVIRDDLSIGNFNKIIKYNTSIWGGNYNLLIPTDGNSINNSWWKNLHIYGPDIVVFCTNSKDDVISKNLQDEIYSLLQPFRLVTWTDWDYSDDNHPLKIVNAVQVMYPLQYDSDKWGEPSESNLTIPQIDESNLFFPYVSTYSGILSKEYRDAYLNLLKAKVIDFNSESLDGYLSALSELANKATPLSITTSHTTNSYERPTTMPLPNGLKVVLVGEKWLHDLCIFWCLKLTQYISFEPQYNVVIPIQTLRSQKGISTFVSSLKGNNVWPSHQIYLLSHSATSRRMKRLQERLSSELQSRRGVQYHQKIPIISSFRCKDVTSEQTRLIQVVDRKFTIERNNPQFEGVIPKGRGCWSVDVEFRPAYEYPMFSELNHIICGKPREEFVNFTGYWFRYHANRFVCYANKSNDLYNGYLPDGTDIFPELFKSYGLNTRENDKRPYTESLSKMLGTVMPLKEPAIRDMLWELARNGPKDFNAINGLLSRGLDTDKCLDTIDSFVHKKILLRGMSLKCANCGLSQWYSLSVIGDELQCPGCLSMIRPPTKAPIQFRLNELILQAVSNGSIAVLLTDAILATQSFTKSATLYGIDIYTDIQAPCDADLVVTYGGRLILAECKEYKNGAYPHEIKKAKKQLTELCNIAKKCDSAIVVLSTLLPLHDDNTKLLAKHAKRLSKTNKLPVHVISLAEMGFVNLDTPSEILVHPNMHWIW